MSSRRKSAPVETRGDKLVKWFLIACAIGFVVGVAIWGSSPYGQSHISCPDGQHETNGQYGNEEWHCTPTRYPSPRDP